MVRTNYNEWFQSGERDFEVANLLFSQSTYYTAVLFHLQQAIEKYVKGYLVSNGWKLRKIHDLESLLNDAISFDADFQQYLDIGRKLTAIYIDERYPPSQANTFTEAEIQGMISESGTLIELIKSKAIHVN